jgi:hypothetical protein
MQSVLMRATKHDLGIAWLVQTSNQTPHSCMYWAWLLGANLLHASQAEFVREPNVPLLLNVCMDGWSVNVHEVKFV